MENNYQLTRIHNYVMGLMSKEEMYEMEREALNDPFLQDAIDGYKLQQGVDSHQLSILQQRLAKKIEAKAEDKKRRFYNWQRLTVGMAAAVLFLVASSLILFKYITHQKTERNNEVILMEHEMHVQSMLMENADALPIGGWEKFNEELNSELRDIHDRGNVQVTFDVTDGKPQNIRVTSSSNKNLDAIISTFIEQKVRWTGENGGVAIAVE